VRPEAIAASEGNLERIPYDASSTAPLREYPEFKARVISEKSAGSEGIELRSKETGFWKPLIYGLLALLAFESLLALFFGLRKR
jgi:hypothetical protein